MVLKDEVQRLRQVPLFGNVAPAKLKLLAFTSKRLTSCLSRGAATSPLSPEIHRPRRLGWRLLRQAPRLLPSSALSRCRKSVVRRI